MHDKLTAALSPEFIEIRDDSHKHAGHAGVLERGGGHYTATIISKAFAGKSSLERQRMVHQILAEEFTDKKIHALALKLKSPDEV